MDFDRHSATYSEEVARSIQYCGLKHEFFSRVKAGHLLETVRAKHGQTASVDILDLGCGTGITDTLIKAHFPRLHGLDVSPEQVAIARQTNPEVAYHVYDGVRSEFADASFDVIFAICVWHHVPVDHWEEFARECHRLLRPGGTLLVYEHNPLNPLTRLSVARCEFDADAVLLSPATVRRLLTAEGFVKSHTEYLLFLPIDRPWCRVVEKRLLRSIPFGAQYVVSATRS
jgi:SAM-dependent methyltransferase